MSAAVAMTTMGMAISTRADNDADSNRRAVRHHRTTRQTGDGQKQGDHGFLHELSRLAEAMATAFTMPAPATLVTPVIHATAARIEHLIGNFLLLG